MASSNQTKLASPIRQQIQAEPTGPAHLLIRVDQATDSVQSQIEAAGFSIHRRLTLVPTFAVSGPVGAALALLDYPWLISIEPDRPVTIQT